MLHIILSITAAFWWTAAFATQEPKPPATNKHPLEAVLVLTPAQCTEESKKGDWFSGKEKFRMGELLCPAAESAVQQAFEKFTRSEAVPEKGSPTGKVILTPKLVDVEATKTVTAFGKRKMVLLVEWTATDDTGKALWVQTVEANTQEKTGNLFTAGSHRRKMLEAIRKDLADKSAQALRQSPELQKLAQKAR
jgi:hypothetical protein